MWFGKFAVVEPVQTILMGKIVCTVCKVNSTRVLSNSVAILRHV